MHHTSNLHNMMLMAKERGRGLEREKSKGRLGQVGRERKRERERDVGQMGMMRRN